MTPDTFTLQEQFIDVGDDHQLYTQEWGNKNAETTFLFLHGGPGTGCNDRHKRRFDPNQHHVIFFDQRGSGRSLPYGSLEHNTTEKLVEDINIILDHYKQEKVVLIGASWGSTLALAYALEHPSRTEALVLQGVFTGSSDEIEWLDKGLFKTFYPEAWEKYLAVTPKSHHNNPTAYHINRVLGEDPSEMGESGFAYEALEGSILSLDDRTHSYDPLEYDPLPIRIEMYYMHHKCFMSDKHILKNASKLKMPVWIVQGRYDMVCPPKTAYELHQNLPNSKLIWTIAGHKGSDRSNDDVIRTILLQFP